MKLHASNTLVLVLLLGGCSASGPARLGTTAEQACMEPRPQVCTMDYRPVCASLATGERKTYANACGACADSAVVSWHEGECQE